jgi:predicted Zn-dependent protease
MLETNFSSMILPSRSDRRATALGGVRGAAGWPAWRNRLFLLLALALAAAPCFGRKPKSPLDQGNRLFDQGKFPEAVAAYDRAAGQDPKDPRVYFDRALANEMVNRSNAIADWKQFLALAGAETEWSSEVKRIKARLLTLEQMPAVPEELAPSHYNSKDDDYYGDIAGPSDEWRWTRWPVRVFLSDPPPRWQEPVQAAVEAWGREFPLQVVNTAKEADVVVKWGSVEDPLEATGTTEVTEQSTLEGDNVVKRRWRATVTLDTTHRLSRAEMLSAALHQLGHALGIRGHSGRITDVMFPQSQHVYAKQRGLDSPTHTHEAPPGIMDRAVTVTKISQRDINTLIRLYNSPGAPLPVE